MAALFLGEKSHHVSALVDFIRVPTGPLLPKVVPKDIEKHHM